VRPPRIPTGNVYRVEGKRRPVWFARYRLPDGREVRKRIGPAWTGRGRPASGFYTRQSAEAWLAEVLGQARRGTLPGMVRTGATFADAAGEYLRYVEQDRGRKRSTVFDYESILKTHLLPAFGQRRLEDVTTVAIEAWLAEVSRRRWRDRPLTARTRNKIIVVLHCVFRRACKVWGLPLNPVAQVERFPERPSGDIDVFSAEEIHALVRATPDPQDAAMFAAAAFTGLRMGELRALRWRDVDLVRSVVRVRASYAMGELTTPKSGKVRSVPLIDSAARLLAALAQRPRFTGDDDLVFDDELGGWISDDRIRRRYTAALTAAQLRPLRFHDLRHTFGSLAITRADIVEVQAWMGHADIKTTMRYLHYRDCGEAARRLGVAFSVPERSTMDDWVPRQVGGGTELSVQAGPAGLG
jgi:integrase